MNSQTHEANHAEGTDVLMTDGNTAAAAISLDDQQQDVEMHEGNHDGSNEDDFETTSYDKQPRS